MVPFLQGEASTQQEEEQEEATGESGVSGTAGKGYDDIDTGAEESSVTQQHLKPHKPTKVLVQ